MRVLITGSSGMLGQALCRKLAPEHEVVGIDVREPIAHPAPFTSFRCGAGSPKPTAFHKLDLTDRVLALQKIKQISPDITIHCAAYTDVDGCELNPEKAHNLNTQATAIIAEGCKLASSSMIYISTDFVFDGEKASPYSEQDMPNPISIYGKTKLAGENAVRGELDNYLIIRTSWLFGAGGRNFVEAILEKAKTQKRIKVVNDQVGSPTYAVDLAKAIADIVDSYQLTTNQLTNSRILNVTNSGSCSWYEFAKEIVNQAGKEDIKVIPISSDQLDRPAKRPKMSILDNTLFFKIHGSSLADWKDALTRYLRERKKNL
ncbi:MAG: dTDP-4-dehydrorhamnose reductase [Candidatus Omnitrophota bacterium]